MKLAAEGGPLKREDWNLVWKAPKFIWFKIVPLGHRWPAVWIYIPTIVVITSFGWWSWTRYIIPAKPIIDSASTLALVSVCGFLVLFLSSVLLMGYRAVAEGRFEALAILVSLTAVTQGFALLVVIIPAPDIAVQFEGVSRTGEIRVIFATLLVVLIVLSVAHLLLAHARRIRTEDRIEEVLDCIWIGCCAPIASIYKRLGKAFLQEDYFPNTFPQNVMDTKKTNREMFVKLLKLLDDYDTEGLEADHFLVTKQREGEETPHKSIPLREVEGSWYLAFSISSGIFATFSLLVMGTAAALIFAMSIRALT